MGGRPLTESTTGDLLDDSVEDHLHRLVALWGVLSDLSFSDLLLFVRSGDGWVVRSQVRPTTAPTVHDHNLVGARFASDRRPAVDRAWRSGRHETGDLFDRQLGGRIGVRAVPVRFDGDVVAVMSVEQAPAPRRHSGELERTYRSVFERFCRMISDGTFPYELGEDRGSPDSPRVGDGVILLDGTGRVQFMSPNAVSALNRAGVDGTVIGTHLAEAGLEQLATRLAYRTRRPTSEEVTAGSVVVDVEVLPLLERSQVSGAVVFLRDVTEIRRRDLLLLSKDATIREIHHRVKNNLQTISSLLRLQGRRVAGREADRAVQESVQRIQAIAVVYELLSREHRDDVDLREIVAAIVRNLDRLTGQHIRIRLEGSAGRVPSSVATPMAIVINELIQNAIDHAFGDLGDSAPGLGERPAEVRVVLQRDGCRLSVEVVDNGIGVMEPVDPQHGGLGLSIVSSLVSEELSGTLSIEPAVGGGTRAFVAAELVAD